MSAARTILAARLTCGATGFMLANRPDRDSGDSPMTALADLLPGKTRAIPRKSSYIVGRPGLVAFLVIFRDNFAAGTVSRALRSDLCRALVPPLRGRDFTAPAHHRAAEQWCAAHLAEGERPVLVALLEQGLLEDLDWLGLAAYVATPSGRRREERHSFSGARTLVLPVPSLDEFASAVISHVLPSGADKAAVPGSEPSPQTHPPVRRHPIAAALPRTDPVPSRPGPAPKISVVRVADTTGIAAATGLASSLVLAGTQLVDTQPAGTPAAAGTPTAPASATASVSPSHAAARPARGTTARAGQPAAGAATSQGPAPLTAVPPTGGAVITLGGSVLTPNGAQVTSGGGVITPGGYVIAPDGTVTTPSDYVITPDGTMVTPNGTLVSNGIVAQPGGTTAGTSITASGTALPDGTFIGLNGMRLPDGTFIGWDGTTLPDGTFIDPKGTILTDGTTISSAGTTLGSGSHSARATPPIITATPSSTLFTASTEATPSTPNSSNQSVVQHDINEGTSAYLDFRGYAARSSQPGRTVRIPSGLGWPGQDS
jgi:hypothetical protein